MQAQALEKPAVGGATPLDRQVLGLAAVAAALQSSGTDALLWGGGSAQAGGPPAAAADGLQWVFGMVGTVSDAGAAVEVAKAEALSLLAAQSETGALSPEAPVRLAEAPSFSCS